MPHLPPSMTPDLARRLAETLENPTLTEKYELARRGSSGSALSFLDEVMSKLSMRGYRLRWAGPEDPDEICSEIRAHVSSLTRHRGQSRTHRTGLVATENIVLDLASPVSASTNPTQAYNTPRRTEGSSETPIRWRHIARDAGFPYGDLPKAAIETLGMLNRVLIRRQGWGLDDSCAGVVTETKLMPRGMAKKGRFSTRSYQRAAALLIHLKLIRVTGINLQGHRIVTPTWWDGGRCEDPLAVWVEAAARFNEINSQSGRRSGAAMS